MKKYGLLLSALYLTASFSAYASYEMDEQKELNHYQTNRLIEKDNLLILGANDKDIAVQAYQSSKGISFKISTEDQEYIPLQPQNISSFLKGVDSFEKLN